MTIPTLLTAKEVASRLKVNVRVVYALVDARELRATRVGKNRRTIRIASSALEEYLAAGVQPARRDATPASTPSRPIVVDTRPTIPESERRRLVFE